jgi:hypothetical protein
LWHEILSSPESPMTHHVPTTSYHVLRSPTTSHHVPSRPITSHQVPPSPTKSHQVPPSPTKSQKVLLGLLTSSGKYWPVKWSMPLGVTSTGSLQSSCIDPCVVTPAIRSFPSLRQYISDQSQCVKNEENRKVTATFVSFFDRAKENRSTMLSIECRCPAAPVVCITGWILQTYIFYVSTRYHAHQTRPWSTRVKNKLTSKISS